MPHVSIVVLEKKNLCLQKMIYIYMNLIIVNYVKISFWRKYVWTKSWE